MSELPDISESEVIRVDSPVEQVHISFQ